MDDLRMVREVYGEIAPDERLRARIQATLADEIDGATPPPVVVPLWRRRAVGVGAIVTAAAAAAGIIAVGAVTGTGTGTGTPAPLAAPTTLSARTILLAAADKAAAEPDGRYWRLHTLDASTGRVEGTHPYTILAPFEFDGWRSKSADDTDYTFQRELAAHPLTAEDKAAWQEAGSPATFRVRNNEDWITYQARDAGWTKQTATPAMKRQAKQSLRQLCADPKAAGKCTPAATLSWADKEKLAADPDHFQELMFPKVPGETPSPANKLQQGYYFLIEQPASPEIRAKAFRVLADLPGVRPVDKATTSDGRSGVGIAASGKMIDGSGAEFEYQMILDPKTYAVIGDKMTVTGGTYRGLAAGTLLNEESVLSAGWTDDAPRHP